MALGSYTLLELESMIRTKIRDYTSIEYGSEELAEEINMKQDEIFLLLPEDKKKAWYGKPVELTLTLDSTTGLYEDDCPLDMWDIIAMKQIYSWNGVTYRKDVKPIEVGEIEEYLSNQFLSDQNGFTVVGQKIQTTFTTARSDDTIMIYYIRVPVTVASGFNFDMPDQLVSIVLIEATMSIVNGMNFDSDAKQIALQMLSMQSKAAREAAGLPLQSTVKSSEAVVAAGMLPGTEPTGGSSGTRPVTD